MSETIFSPSAIKQLNSLKDVLGSGVEYIIAVNLVVINDE